MLNIKCYTNEDGDFRGFNFGGIIIDLDTVYDSYESFVDSWYDEGEPVKEVEITRIDNRYVCDISGCNDGLYFTVDGDIITIYFSEYNSMRNDLITTIVEFNTKDKTFRDISE